MLYYLGYVDKLPRNTVSYHEGRISIVLEYSKRLDNGFRPPV
jgi:hypothetical protein